MAQARPEAIFLLSPETGIEWTFAELHEQSNRIAQCLFSWGLRPGDKVAFLLDNGVFTAGLFLGAMYGAFVPVPLNVQAGQAQLTYTLEHCDANMVFVSPEYKSALEEARARVGRKIQVILTDVDHGPCWQETGTPELALPAIEPASAALLAYTSGSTAQPKGVLLTHRQLLAGARNSVLAHRLSSQDHSFCVLPIYHLNAPTVTLIPTLLTGGSVVLPHRFQVHRFWAWLTEYRCTWAALVPTIIAQLLDWIDPRAEGLGEALEKVRFVRSSSAPLAPILHKTFEEKFQLLLIESMGLTECGGVVFSNPLPPGANKIGSPGLPCGFEARLAGPDGAAVPVGEPGEILVRGPSTMLGYYKDPDGTAAVLGPDGWLRTGDLARVDADGYFFIVGRAKELIIKGGINIAPRLIDEVLECHPAVREAAALGVPDRYFGEDIVAFVVPKEASRLNERELLDFCEARLGNFKTPTRVCLVTDLPRGPSGKARVFLAWADTHCSPSRPCRVFAHGSWSSFLSMTSLRTRP
jgi:long-chain acyl-CoA synthetase